MADQLNLQRSPQDFKVATVASFILTIYGNIKYVVGRGHASHLVSSGPFTTNVFMMIGYFAMMYILQFFFLFRVYAPAEEAIFRNEEIRKVTVHFFMFNILQFVWNYLFAHKHWFLSEIVVLLNFFNVLGIYFSHRTYKMKPLKTWFLVHVAICAFPLSWLLYAIFWNGAVLFHIHKFVGRVVSNVLIWDFLLVPGMFLILFGDYGVGFTSAYIAFALALGQFFTKLFALQWIFALIIGSLVFLLSVIVAFSPSFKARGSIEDSESAPLLT